MWVNLKRCVHDAVAVDQGFRVGNEIGFEERILSRHRTNKGNAEQCSEYEESMDDFHKFSF